MHRRSDRRGSTGFQLAALVDLLFVITFLLIWERESLMHKRLAKIRAAAKAVQVDVKKIEQAQKAAQKASEEALARAEKEKLKAQDEVKQLSERLAQQFVDKAREKKLEQDLHLVFDWMLEGMRNGRDTSVMPAQVRAVLNSLGPPPPPAPSPAPSPAQRVR